MLRMNGLLIGLALLFYLVGICVFPFEMNSRGVQHQLFLLTGLAAWFAWAEALVIASRPAWIERLAGEPLDRLMQGHKRLGRIMAAAAFLHVITPLIVMALPIKQISGMSPHDTGTVLKFIWVWLHPLAALSGMIATVWVARVIWLDARRAMKKMPWDAWEKAHRAWAWLFLLFIPHSLRLMKESELLMPLGWLNIAVTAAGAIAAVSILRHHAGKARRASAIVREADCRGDELLLQLKTPLAASIRPGAFAYLSLPGEDAEPHPFTVVSAEPEKGVLGFWIKKAGSWTGSLAGLKPGDPILVEGPWGSFHPDFSHPSEGQAWLAGGMGLAPFMAWMTEASRRRAAGEALPRITLWWFVRDKRAEPILPEVEAVALRAGIALRVFETGTDHRRPDPAEVLSPEAGRVEVCGSEAFARAFKASWKALGRKGVFRSEAC